jgi:hypothetical protein
VNGKAATSTAKNSKDEHPKRTLAQGVDAGGSDPHFGF